MMTLETYMKRIAQELEQEIPQADASGAYTMEIDGYTLVFKKGSKGEPLIEYALAQVKDGVEGEEQLRKILRYNFVFLKRDPQCVLSFDTDRRSVYFWRNIQNDEEENIVFSFEKLINNLDIVNKVIHN